jgi:uncharacterized protein (TIGR01777 family)
LFFSTIAGMKIVVSGGSGFIGHELVPRLIAAGHDVAVLTRNASHVRAGRAVLWNGAAKAIADADAVVNLAGENVGGGRWTESRKRRIVDSRLEATRTIAEALRAAPKKPRALIGASAVGFYGFEHGDESLDETAPAGGGFLAEVTRLWEAAARAAEDVARVVVLRFGVVLGKGGGALGKMLLPFRLGAGGPIGSGEQWMSWVDRSDVVRAIEWAVANESARGVYNVAAPEPVRNRDFGRTLGAVLHRPAVMPAPAFALRAVLGSMADEMLLGGQRVLPSRLQAEGFSFEYGSLDASLRHVLAK